MWCEIQNYQNNLYGISNGILYCELWTELNNVLNESSQTTSSSGTSLAPMTPTPTYTITCKYEDYPNGTSLCNLYCQIVAFDGGLCLNSNECPYLLQISETLLCDLWNEIQLANTSSVGSTQSPDFQTLIGNATASNGAIEYTECPYVTDANSFTACSLWCELRLTSMGEICSDAPICPYENYTMPTNTELCNLWFELQGLIQNPPGSSPSSPSSPSNPASPTNPSSPGSPANPSSPSSPSNPASPAATATTTATPMQCTTDSECQENAGCFIIEPLELDPITGAPKTTCHCGLGYLLDNSTASYPKTGTCENLRTRPCTGNTATDYCITNTEGWGVCPYCRVRFLVLFGLVVSNISILSSGVQIPRGLRW